MGTVYAEVELINCDDISLARRHIIDQDEVRCVRVTMLVDSGAYMMAINEFIQEQMGFGFQERRVTQLASGEWVEYKVVGPIRVKFANRTATCNAFVLPRDSEPLLGAIPMEELDVLIHPKRQELIVNPLHPEGAVLRL